MGILIDSTAFVDDERGRLSLQDHLARFEDQSFFISAITLMELHHGLHRADSMERFSQRKQRLDRWANRFTMLPVNDTVAATAGRMRADLQTRGVTIGVSDLLIGSTGLVWNLIVATANERDFGKIPGLRLLVWKGSASGARQDA